MKCENNDRFQKLIIRWKVSLITVLVQRITGNACIKARERYRITNMHCSVKKWNEELRKFNEFSLADWNCDFFFFSSSNISMQRIITTTTTTTTATHHSGGNNETSSCQYAPVCAALFITLKNRAPTQLFGGNWNRNGVLNQDTKRKKDGNLFAVVLSVCPWCTKKNRRRKEPFVFYTKRKINTGN